MPIPLEFFARGRNWATIALAAVILGSCRQPAAKPAPGNSGGPEQKAGIAVAPTPASNRIVFPWSVVSGGVDSPMAMRAAMQGDPVVDAHYAGLNPAFFRPEVLPAKRQAYVSYRIRDNIYWTRRKVTLQAGETVLNDGQFLVRGRCGNLISATPREPVAPAAMEPEEPVMDRPVPEAQLVYSPPPRTETAVETGSLQNPIALGTDKEMMTVLPPPDPREMLPPVWTAGGSSGGIGGIIGTAGGGGAGVPPSTPGPPGSPPPEIPVPVSPVVPIWTWTPPVEVAPPLVFASLLLPPENPSNPGSITTPGYPWPGSTGEHPGTPGSTPFPPYSPPQIPYPPPDNRPPPTPPPGSPPPSGPPPSHPPPSDPPKFEPPSSPPDSPEEGEPIPEPGPWILFALGLAGLAVGTIRRKY